MRQLNMINSNYIKLKLEFLYVFTKIIHSES